MAEPHVSSTAYAAQRLRRFVLRWFGLAALASLGVTIYALTTGAPAPSLQLVAVLLVCSVLCEAAHVGVGIHRTRGVVEMTSLVELTAVLLMVLLSPPWAVAIAVTGSVIHGVMQRRELRKLVFNASSEAAGVALGAGAYLALAGTGFSGSWGDILAALAAGAIYVAVDVVAFADLLAITCNRSLAESVRDEAEATALLNYGIATTGVLAAVLAGAAPYALPLLALPTLFDYVRAKRRTESVDLAIAKERAEAANQAKTQFLSRMSHELRTPLNAIVGFGQLLGLDDNLDDKTRDSIELILSSGEHLLMLIDDLLDLSGIEAGAVPLSMQRVSVCEVAAESVAILRPLAAHRSIDLHLAADDTVHALADQRRLKQVLINLVANGVKYNQPGGQVTISVADTAEGIRIDVVDTGIGISPEDIPRLFVPFERLSAAGTAIEGTGLGLTLSNQLVVAMDGELEVASEVGGGSTFSVILKRAEAPAAACIRASASPESDGTVVAASPVDDGGSTVDNVRVLIAEDNPVNQAVAIAMLAKIGYAAHVVSNGQEAVAAVEREVYAAVLMDCQMPVLNGYDAAAEIRRRAGAGPRIPIIAVTADAMKGEQERCLAAGMDDYLAKPVRIENLAATLRRWAEAPVAAGS